MAGFAESFAELAAATNYSFLRGASHPGEMVHEAIRLGMAGIGIADRNSVAGVVRALIAMRDALEDLPEDRRAAFPFRLVVGARLCFVDGTPDIIAYPATRYGWGRLTRLLTVGNRRAVKGDCLLQLKDLLEHSEDLLLTAMADESDEFALRRLQESTMDRLWLGVTMPRSGCDHRVLEKRACFAEKLAIPMLATNDALYATPQQRQLHDVLTCIREGTTIAHAGKLLATNAERHLKPPEEMARLFRDYPQAIAATTDLLARIAFSLDDLRYEYPHEPVPKGWEPQSWLEHIVMEAAHERYGRAIPPEAQKLIDEEFSLIRDQDYAYYFLTVHDVVKFARAQDPPILCQGRGSAANSMVCFLLGITSVDPVRYNLLFSRFVSRERKEPPDIDVDFEHERREEVMQYIYDRYGRERAGIAATVIHYRPRSAVREVGKALGFSEDVTTRLSSTVWGSHSRAMQEQRIAESGFSLDNPEIARLKALVDQILEFPRHLSQHVGGYVLTEGRLDELVPIHNGAMKDRTFIEWDKDDIDALGLMKVDILALGMLTCIRKSFDLMRLHGLGDYALDTIQHEDAAVYKMLQKGDSIGVFQVESRAQINMLPRLKPAVFYDLVIQVAIVRPGPIEGDMVHPFLRRRQGIEKVVFPSPNAPHDPDELKTVLGKTMGVPLFQEQAMKLAIVAAEFSPEDANRLRRAMATFRNVGTIDQFEKKMIEGMVSRGYERDFAERCFRQIEGFGSYGFPESHALSFARLVYVSSWIKCHHPAVFTCALLNSQPMGFYAPAQLVRDLRDHGGEVREPDINASTWDNSLEPLGDDLALRIGFRQIDGFRAEWAQQLEKAREKGAFITMEDLARRANLPRRALRLLADADACHSIGKNRRQSLWDVQRMPQSELPLFAAAKECELRDEADPNLPAMPLSEHVVADYQTVRLSLKGHPMAFLRALFESEGVLSCAATNAAKNGKQVRTAGVVLIRQRPGKGNAIFITIEDETGIVNALLWARHLERLRRAVMASRLMEIHGEIQRSAEGVVHLMATHVVDRTEALDRLSDGQGVEPELSPADEIRNSQIPRGRGHPRNVRILPKSRDFH
ncbi:error-prone DNA polymerase [Parasphingopyxis lamellibrachiae]|uniref:Error-prone DNA polymerase n=1 Tax=Parasphingopyxis lamellibrachiae TaxID=680125 RepID=A0A3D9FF02_9SPHN|nr:error-prone DNA polymerase [Parasphingopyxis lamellibrachiae]RED16303.1 DnaE-like error-prone DNA polymerase [Parasphingopyxis lamellibrachiae]